MTRAERIAWCQRHTPAENAVALHRAAQWFHALPDNLRLPGATALLKLPIVCLEHERGRTRRA